MPGRRTPSARVLLVTDRPDDWPLELPGVEVVEARRYLTEPGLVRGRGVRVWNLCRHYRYQSVGYYVSLLATARGHRPLPSVATLQDLRHRSLVRLVSEDLEDLVEKSLRSLTSDDFTLSIYFGRNVAKKYDRLARELYNLFPAPLLRARFVRRPEPDEAGAWEVRSLRPIAGREVPPSHWDFVFGAARDHFAHRQRPSRRTMPRYDLAILVDPSEDEPPSNAGAIQRFVRAGRRVGFAVEEIGPDDIGRLAEFDALFIRRTTSVNDFTYRFARRAEAEGLVVIDDPDSIVRCTNKVFLAESLERAGIPAPRTLVLHKGNLDDVAASLGFPVILKRPDSAFSQGVVRVSDAEELRQTALAFLEDSELLIAQEFLPTDFDWRVGLLGGGVLFAARYHMARSHWQIIQRDATGKPHRWGNAEAVAVEDLPPEVGRRALAAGATMGDGFYGVDLKEKDGKVVVIEVNDNPSVDAGYEDRILGPELYHRIMAFLMERVERRKLRPEDA